MNSIPETHSHSLPPPQPAQRNFLVRLILKVWSAIQRAFNAIKRFFGFHPTPTKEELQASRLAALTIARQRMAKERGDENGNEIKSEPFFEKSSLNGKKVAKLELLSPETPALQELVTFCTDFTERLVQNGIDEKNLDEPTKNGNIKFLRHLQVWQEKILELSSELPRATGQLRAIVNASKELLKSLAPDLWIRFGSLLKTTLQALRGNVIPDNEKRRKQIQEEIDKILQSLQRQNIDPYSLNQLNWLGDVIKSALSSGHSLEYATLLIDSGQIFDTALSLKDQSQKQLLAHLHEIKENLQEKPYCTDKNDDGLEVKKGANAVKKEILSITKQLTQVVASRLAYLIEQTGPGPGHDDTWAQGFDSIVAIINDGLRIYLEVKAEINPVNEQTKKTETTVLSFGPKNHFELFRNHLAYSKNPFYHSLFRGLAFQNTAVNLGANANIAQHPEHTQAINLSAGDQLNKNTRQALDALYTQVSDKLIELLLPRKSKGRDDQMQALLHHIKLSTNFKKILTEVDAIFDILTKEADIGDAQVFKNIIERLIIENAESQIRFYLKQSIAALFELFTDPLKLYELAGNSMLPALDELLLSSFISLAISKQEPKTMCMWLENSDEGKEKLLAKKRFKGIDKGQLQKAVHHALEQDLPCLFFQKTLSTYFIEFQDALLTWDLDALKKKFQEKTGLKDTLYDEKIAPQMQRLIDFARSTKETLDTEKNKESEEDKIEKTVSLTKSYLSNNLGEPNQHFNAMIQKLVFEVGDGSGWWAKKGLSWWGDSLNTLLGSIFYKMRFSPDFLIKAIVDSLRRNYLTDPAGVDPILNPLPAERFENPEMQKEIGKKLEEATRKTGSILRNFLSYSFRQRWWGRVANWAVMSEEPLGKVIQSIFHRFLGDKLWNTNLVTRAVEQVLGPINDQTSQPLHPPRVEVFNVAPLHGNEEEAAI